MTDLTCTDRMLLPCHVYGHLTFTGLAITTLALCKENSAGRYPAVSSNYPPWLAASPFHFRRAVCGSMIPGFVGGLPASPTHNVYLPAFALLHQAHDATGCAVQDA